MSERSWNNRFERLLRPRSIAVIGGGAWCEAVVCQNKKLGFDGDIWPVHRNKPTVGGTKAYSSIEDIPGIPDAAFVGVNRTATIDVVKTLRDIGTGGAVCFASGFREKDDGIELQSKLLSAAGDMTVLGPNCYGFVNYVDGVLLWPDQHGGLPVKTGVAIVAQSSNIAINLTMQKRGLPLAYAVTVGNQAQIGLAQVGMAMLEDDRVTALGLHIEGIDDLPGFQRLAKMAETLNKPIVVLKVGRSEGARKAAKTHTAALAGTDAGAKALFERLGFAQVDTLPQLTELLKLLHVSGPLPNTNISSMSCSGGEAGLISDLADQHDLTFPALSSEQSIRLQNVLGPLVSPSNPLDYHTQIWRDQAALADTFSTMATESVAISLVIADFPRDDRCNGDDWNVVVDACLDVRATGGKNLAVVATLPENMPESASQRLMEGNVVPFCGLEDACLAIRKAVLPRRDATPMLVPGSRDLTSVVTLNESTAKESLARAGIRTPRSEVATTPHLAASAAKSIGFPVALKGEGFAHKSENGAVVLNLGSSQAVIDAAKSMPANHFLIEEMITDSVVELLVGVVRDEAHGFVLTIAAGGVLTELMQDQQSLLVPASETAIDQAMSKLKIAPVLGGYRGRPAIDRQAVIDAVNALQEYVATNAEALDTIEINPLLCSPSGAIAVDALITRKADP